MIRKNQTDWGKGVSMIMTQRNMTMRDLSDLSNVPYSSVCGIVSGCLRSDDSEQRVSDALGLSREQIRNISRTVENLLEAS